MATVSFAREWRRPDAADRVFDATGVRLRAAPFRADRVKAARGSGQG
jgi:hypothetical protein